MDIRPVPFRQLLESSYRAYAGQFQAFFLVALATVPLQMLSAVIADRVESSDTENLLMVPLQFADAFVFMLTTGALIHGASLVASGAPVDAGAALDAALAKFIQILTTQLLFALLVIGSIAAFPYTAYRYLADIPRTEGRGALTAVGAILGASLYFWVRWIFSVQSVMLENRQNWAALDASAALVRGAWWPTLLRLAGIVFVAILPVSFIAGAASYLPVLAAATVTSLLLALVAPFVIIAQTHMYLDLKQGGMAHDLGAD